MGVGVSAPRGVWGVKETIRPMAMLTTTKMLIIQNMRCLRETDAFLRRMVLTRVGKGSIQVASQLY